jgi:hypothetical protein
MKMKKVTTDSDYVLVSYNDRPDAERDAKLFEAMVTASKNGDEEGYEAAYDALGASRWELKRAGLKPSSGFAPMYAYQPRNQQLLALCAHAPDLPFALTHNLRALATEALSSSKPWKASMVSLLDSTVMSALCARLTSMVEDNGDSVVCFSRTQAGANSLWTELQAAGLTSALVFEPGLRPETTLALFEERGGVLLVSDRNCTGWRTDGIDVLLHVDVPNDYATLAQRESRGGPVVTVAYLNDEVRTSCLALCDQARAQL